MISMNILPIITSLFLYCFYQKKNNHTFGPISYLILVYLIMGLSSIAIQYSGKFSFAFEFSIQSMTYLSIAFIISFIGFYGYRDEKINNYFIYNMRIYGALEKYIMIIGFISIIYFSYFAYIRLKSDIRIERINISDTITNGLARFGIVNSVLSLGSNLFILAILFAFINFMKGTGYRRKAILLLISSLSYIVYILAYLGRDGFVYWIMTFLFFFFMFRKFINNQIKKIIKKAFVIVVVLGIIPFIIISVQRFSNLESNLIWQIINYSGQQIGNFNDRYLINAPIDYGRNSFPEFIAVAEKLGIHIPDKFDKSEIQSYYLEYNVHPAVFATFIGSFLNNFGKYGTILIIIINSIIIKKIVKKISGNMHTMLSDIVLFTLFSQIILWGVFYFRQYSANWYLVAMIAIYFYLKRKEKIFYKIIK